jgi:integration host factor subunit beta
MIRSELVARLHGLHPHLQNREVERAVAAVFDAISKTLAGEGRVELRGFGAFSVKVWSSRMGRNPQTGQPVLVAEKRRIYYRMSRDMRRRLNAPIEQPLSSGSSATTAPMSAP